MLDGGCGEVFGGAFFLRCLSIEENRDDEDECSEDGDGDEGGIAHSGGKLYGSRETAIFKKGLGWVKLLRGVG